MKRTSLILDEELLKTATRVLGEKTYSATVNRALQESLKNAQIRGLADLFGTGAWEGDLASIRGDHKTASRRSKR